MDKPAIPPSPREQERRRLARHLQARLGSLNLLLAQANAYRAALAQAAGPAQAFGGMEALAAMAAHALNDLQDMVVDLAPTDLDDLSLPAALESLALRVERRYGLALALHVPSTIAPPPAHLALAVYRIAQEAMHNAGQHAGAGRVGLSLHTGQGDLRLTVADDGHGFYPPEPLAALAAEGKLGLAQMVELAQALGGQVEVHSVIGVGTQVRATLPLGPAAVTPAAQGDDAPIEPLTSREQEVLAGVAQGLTNKQIAVQLGISDRTVQFHLSNVLGKLGLASRTEAAVLALQKGWV